MFSVRQAFSEHKRHPLDIFDHIIFEIFPQKRPEHISRAEVGADFGGSRLVGGCKQLLS